MNPADLLNNPQLQNISPEKLALLMNLAQNNSPKETPQEMAESLKMLRKPRKNRVLIFLLMILSLYFLWFCYNIDNLTRNINFFDNISG